MIKLCIWMNIPSHLQSGFFKALHIREDVDLQVRYFQKGSSVRVAEGWTDSYDLGPFEGSVEGMSDPDEILDTVPDARGRIHVSNCNFNVRLIDYFCAHDIPWCHWAERPGIRLAEKLNYCMPLFRILNPLMLLLKQKESRRIRKHALGALGQGRLAIRSFRIMGVPKKKCAQLYYATEAPKIISPSARMVEFAKGRKIFLTACALTRRKGIEDLLRAFARCDSENWCLVLCGLDKSNGVYPALAETLGIHNRVLFFGAHPSIRLGEIYAAADVFVLASRFDGWGAVLNEAASMGLPLVATDMCGAAWHLIQEESNGIRVRAGSVAALQKGMQRYVGQPDLIDRHGAESRSIFEARFTPEKNAERMVKILRDWGIDAG